MAAPDTGATPAQVHRASINALNRRDLGATAQVVKTARYRENCVGFTKGFVDWEGAKASLIQVWKGLPDLRVDLDSVPRQGTW